MFVSNTPAWEMENSKLAITGNLIINTMVLVLFSLIAPFRMDAAKSKPLIGFFGLSIGYISKLSFGLAPSIGARRATNVVPLLQVNFRQ